MQYRNMLDGDFAILGYKYVYWPISVLLVLELRCWHFLASISNLQFQCPCSYVVRLIYMCKVLLRILLLANTSTQIEHTVIELNLPPSLLHCNRLDTFMITSFSTAVYLVQQQCACSLHPPSTTLINHYVYCLCKIVKIH